MPSVAWFTIDVWRSESDAVSSDMFSAWPPVLPCTSATWSSSSPGFGWPLSASPYPASRSSRSLRAFVWSTPSTWSSCTGAAVCDAGMVSPSEIVSALGDPGLMSMKRLPSRKMRSRTFTSASLWIGRASSFSFIVTFTPCESSPAGSTFETLPTSTPAIRTAVPF